jgi:flagellar hook assembly protein FlgD
VFPNPFQGSLNVSFSLAREARVRIEIFDLAGRVVRHLEDGPRPAGAHIATWDGSGDAGVGLSPGSYIVRFESGEIRQNRRVQLIR